LHFDIDSGKAWLTPSGSLTPLATSPQVAWRLKEGEPKERHPCLP
jgi:hypothetical protein